MTRWRPARSLRLSLTLWHVAAMFVVLGLYAATVFTVVSRNASEDVDDRLRGDFRWAAEMVEQNPDGSLVWFEGDDGTGDTPWLQVWSPRGEVLVRSRFAEQMPIPDSRSLASLANGRIVSVPAGGLTFRVLSNHSRIGNRLVVIQVARSEAMLRQWLRQLTLILVLGLPLGIAVAGLAGYSLARRALAPVDRMADRARSITAERLGERLPIDNPSDELGRLASVFNDTLGRLESAFDQMRRFTADVSHQLRTPLAAIRSVGEVGLSGRRSESAYRGVIASMLEEVDRLSALIDRLLAFSRAEAGMAKLSIELVDLHVLATGVVQHLGVLAEEKRQTIVLERDGTPQCLADRTVLRHAVTNLVDNAIKYAPAEGRIVVRVEDRGARVVLSVSDDGPGVSPEARARLFNRFHRGSEHVANGTGGSGLGLAIAKWAVEAHGGTLSLEEDPRAPSGCTFTVALTAASHGRLRADLRASA